MTINDILNFEFAFEDAVTSAFKDADIACITPQVAPKLQRDRPRVEGMFRKGAGKGVYLPIHGLPPLRENCIETTWAGSLTLDAITEADVASHAQFKVALRKVALRLPALVNNIYLPYHKLHWPIRDSGDGEMLYSKEKNLFVTSMKFDFDFSLQANALEAFTQQQE